MRLQVAHQRNLPAERGNDLGLVALGRVAGIVAFNSSFARPARATAPTRIGPRVHRATGHLDQRLLYHERGRNHAASGVEAGLFNLLIQDRRKGLQPRQVGLCVDLGFDCALAVEKVWESLVGAGELA